MVQKVRFLLLFNTNMLVYYALLSFIRIKVYRVETMHMVRFQWNHGVSGIFNPSKYCGTYCMGLATLVGVIWC